MQAREQCNVKFAEQRTMQISSQEAEENFIVALGNARTVASSMGWDAQDAGISGYRAQEKYPQSARNANHRIGTNQERNNTPNRGRSCLLSDVRMV